MLTLNNLTPHQRERLIQCNLHVRVRLAAPAGAGKTFVAVHLVLRAIPRASYHDDA